MSLTTRPRRRLGTTVARALAGSVAALLVTLASASEPPLTAEQKALNVASFDEVWTTVRDRNFDPTLGGIDWDAVKTELRPKVERADSMETARAAMTEMLGRIKQSHFGIIPGTVYADVEDAIPDSESDADGGTGDPGLSMRVIGGEPVVVAVEAGSPAESVGVKAGWILRSVEGKPVTDVLERLRSTKGDGIQFLTYGAFALERRTQGEIGHAKKFEFLGEKNAVESRAITMRPPSGTASTFGNLPTIYVTFQHKRMPLDGGGDCGYIAFSSFLNPGGLMPKITAAMESFADCKGVILDLRGNIGGLGAMAMGVSGHFFDERVTLGELVTREGTIKFVVNPRAEPFSGAVAVLVDECSVSTAEILAGGLKDLGRARVFGTRTAGQALPSMIVRLPNGDGFQFAFANYTSANGKPLEGDGVVPDEVAPPTREALLAGRDPAMEAAKAWFGKAAHPQETGTRSTQ